MEVPLAVLAEILANMASSVIEHYNFFLQKQVNRYLRISKDSQNCKLPYYDITYNNNNNNVI